MLGLRCSRIAPQDLHILTAQRRRRRHEIASAFELHAQLQEERGGFEVAREGFLHQALEERLLLRERPSFASLRNRDPIMELLEEISFKIAAAFATAPGITGLTLLELLAGRRLPEADVVFSAHGSLLLMLERVVRRRHATCGG